MRDNLKDFQLNTDNMAATAEQCKTLADKMSALRAELREAKDSLLFTWVGEGRNEFEKQFRLLDQQFSDIVDDTINKYNGLWGFIDGEGNWLIEPQFQSIGR